MMSRKVSDGKAFNALYVFRGLIHSHNLQPESHTARQLTAITAIFGPSLDDELSEMRILCKSTHRYL